MVMSWGGANVKEEVEPSGWEGSRDWKVLVEET